MFKDLNPHIYSISCETWTINRGMVWGQRRPWFYTCPSTFSLCLFIYQIWSSTSSSIKLGKGNKNTSYDHCKYQVNIDGVLYLVHSKCSINSHYTKENSNWEAAKSCFLFRPAWVYEKDHLNRNVCVCVYMCKSTSDVFKLLFII